MTTILVTGGAGYIGSHIVRELAQAGYKAVLRHSVASEQRRMAVLRHSVASEQRRMVVTYDNLQCGHRGAVKHGRFILGDLLTRTKLESVFSRYRFDAVFHLAGYISVGESMRLPSKYLRNNVVAGAMLLETMAKNKVNKIIFSSTAVIYAETGKRLKENSPTGPTNPYGISKWMFEQMLEWHSRNNGLHYVSLRYFNAAGAHQTGDIGEDHQPETHLIPLALKTALGQFPYLAIFGDDYPTKDGTCIRDYIHVSDLAQAHILALQRLLKKPESHIYNLGNGTGFSVKEIIATAQEVTGRRIKTRIMPRRAGDQPILVADASKIHKELGWRPRYKTIASIIESAWRWHQSHPTGFSPRR